MTTIRPEPQHNAVTDSSGESRVPRGRRAPWPALFLALNAAGFALILWQMHWLAGPSDGLNVAHASPAGEEVPVDVGRVAVRFSGPLDPDTVNDDTLRLVPLVRGKTILHGDRELRLELGERLQKATRYRIVISPKLRGATGLRPSAGLAGFSTPALAVLGVSQARIEADGSSVIAISFNGPVDPKMLAPHLNLAYPDGTPVRFALVSGRPSDTLRIRVPRAKWRKLDLQIAAGLTGTRGPIPLGATRRTTVLVAADLRYLGMAAECGRTRGRIKVRMNSPVKIGAADAFVHVSPPVKRTLERSSDGLDIAGAFKPGARYTVTLKAGLPAGAAGTLEKDITRAVWVPDRPKAIGFACSYGYLSPTGLLQAPVRSTNVKSARLVAQRLYANNIVEYALRRDGRLPWSLSADLPARTLPIACKQNEDVETLVSLSSLGEGEVRGVYGLGVRDSDNRWRNDDAIVVVTDLGLSSRFSARRAFVWVTSISAAKPVEGVEVSVYSGRRQKLGSAVTGTDGIAEVALAATPSGERPALILAAKENDLTFMTLRRNERSRGPGSAKGRPYLSKGYEVFVCCERGVYRPGDTLRISGLIRGAAFETPPPMPLELVVSKPDGRELLRRTAMSELTGRLLADVVVPRGAPTGRYTISCRLPGGRERLGATRFQVADYIPRTLRMRLSAPAGPLPASKGFKVTARVEHLFGDPAQGLETKCRARYTAAEFRPDGWEGYRFGDARRTAQTRTVDCTAKTLDAAGEAAFKLKAPTLSTPAAIEASAEVEVQEPGGRAMIEILSRRLDPWDFYLGAKAPGSDPTPGRPVAFAVAAVRPAGKAHSAVKHKATFFRVMYSNVLRRRGQRLEYEWTRKDRPVATVAGKFTGGLATIAFTPEHPGPYRLLVESEGGCPVTLDFSVSGATAQWAVADPEELRLTLDRRSYKPGEMATLRVHAPFGGIALICVESDRVLRRHVLSLPNGGGAVQFIVDESWRPNVYLTAAVVRPVTPEDEWRPHRASGTVRLDVDCGDRALDLAIDCPSEARPQREIEVAVRAALGGQPKAGAAVVLAAVDEGVLALTAHKGRSPWDFFYAPRRVGVREYDMFSRLAPELSRWKVGKEAEPGGGGGRKGEPDMTRRLNPIYAQRVKTAVLYAGVLTTDDRGVARARFTVPEYVGELRLTAWGAAGKKFGFVRKALPVKSPVMVRPSWPRFLAPGDVFDLPVTVFNRTAEDGAVQIKLASEGPLAPADALPESVYVPAGGEETVRLRLRATGVGKVAARITASLGAESYTESVEIPVRPAVAFARIAGGAVVEGPGEKEIAIPGGLIPRTAKCSLVIAGSPTVELSGALRYLLDYPYGCVEQTTSRLVPLVYLRDLAELACPQSVGSEEIETILTSGFQRLRMMQTASGGLAMWPGGDEPHPWGSLYAGDLLVEAKKAGFPVPRELLGPLLDYVDEQMNLWGAADGRSDLPTQPAELAYGCYVLARAGRPAYTWMGRLEDLLVRRGPQRTTTPATARCHLAGAYLAAGQAQAARKLVAGVRTSVMRRETGGSLRSPVREAAIMLSVLLDLTGEAEQTAALAHRIKSNLKLGAWATTQENAFALMALGKYARRLGPTPDAKVIVTLPDGATRTCSARGGLRLDSIRPGEFVRVKVEGQGRAYVFWHAEGVPKQGVVEEKDAGLSIRRTFLSADGKTQADPQKLGQGELYQVRLVVRAGDATDNVVITALLPSGLELEDPNLKGSARISSEGAKGWLRTDHVERRDDRVLVFGRLRTGRNEFRYLVRAVTAGTFVLPAVEASCMYDPGLYSVNGRGIVRIVP